MFLSIKHEKKYFQSKEQSNDLAVSSSISECDELKRDVDVDQRRPEPIIEPNAVRGLEAEQIISCTDISGQMQFMVKWKNLDKADLVNAKEAKAKYPQIVQDFFQERLSRNSK